MSTHIPLIMGILNLSPLSFYNAIPNYDDALKKAERMTQEGAAILDVGAVATNPFVNLSTQTPSEQQELDRLIPFIEKLSRTVDIMISVDTYRPKVMQESVNAGARMINDQHALTEENTLETAVKLNVPVCLMHHFCDRDRGSDSNEQLLETIVQDLTQYAKRCLSAGMKREHIILDPGFGGGNFGKSAEENFYILDHLESIVDLGFPVLAGLSRKSMFDGKVEDRLPASLDGAVRAAKKGVAILRVHDVRETEEALHLLNRSLGS